MLKRGIFLLLLGTCFSCFAVGPEASLGVYRSLEKFEDEEANEDKDPFRPMIKLGYKFPVFYSVNFSPQFFYTFGSKESNDSFGGDYSVKIYGFLFDVLYPIYDTSFGSFSIRTGLGHIVKSIKGEGGEVTVPNGTGTTTAYRPEESDKSHTGTLNLGFDFTMASSALFLSLKQLGFRFEYLASSLFRSEKRAGHLMLSLQGYF